MSHSYSHHSAEDWLLHLFSSRAARKGETVRRKLSHVDQFVGRDAFYEELKRRGFHAVENAGQVVVFCNQDPIKPIL